MKSKLKIVIFLIGFFLFFCTIPALTLAAREVSGSVPKVEPLEPAAVNISPNISHNIQYQDPSHEGEFDASGNVVSITKNQPQPDQSNQASASLSTSPLFSGPKWYEWILWILVILFVLSTVVWAFRNEKK